MLLNVSNHPSERWSEEQMEAARMLAGEVRDFPFPAVDPLATASDIARQAHEAAAQIAAMLSPGDVVHAMGELTFTFALVRELMACGIRCVASTSCRDAVELDSGEKFSTFHFTSFRDYIM